jgi:hypothetical protein
MESAGGNVKLTGSIVLKNTADSINANDNLKEA